MGKQRRLSCLRIFHGFNLLPPPFAMKTFVFFSTNSGFPGRRGSRGGPALTAVFGRWVKIVLLTVFLAGARGTGQAGESPWASLTGLTQAQLDSRLAHWEADFYGLVPVCLSGYEENGQIRYAVLMNQSTDGLPRRVLRGMSPAGFLSMNDSLQDLGWRLTWLGGFESGGADYYNAIYRKSNGSAQTVRVGDTQSGHQSADASLKTQGYVLDNVCAFGSGSSVRYGAWWNRTQFSVATEVSYNLSADAYQEEFNLRSGTWRLHNVCGFRNAAGSNRITVVWKKPALNTGWGSSHMMTKANYFAAQSNQTLTGRRPVFQQAWADGSEVRFNAVWVEDGGIGSFWASRLDAAINEHLQTNGIPGASLAISRNGRLVYAKGYGLASKETGEYAGAEHRWRMASVSKAITGVSVVHALAKYPGRSLNSRLFGADNNGIFGNDYGTPPYSQREKAIRLSHVLHHTAGWPEDGHLWYYESPGDGSAHKPYMDYQLNSVTQTSDPGDTGRYSNLGFCMAARVVEKLSGQTYENYTLNEVFKPCGLDTLTGIVIGERTRAQKKFMEVSYYPKPNENDDPEVVDPRRMDGSTGWIAKPLDLLLFARRVDGNATHADILSAAGVEDLRTPANPLPASDEGYGSANYGLGWATDNINNPRTWGHNGGMAGTGANLVVRRDGFSWAWMTNTRLGGLDALIETWISEVTAAGAWPDIDLFPSANPSYDAWEADKFAAVDRGQAGLRDAVYGPGADPDGDGIPNAGELYFGMEPLESEKSPFSVAKDGNNLRVRWLKSSTARGVRVLLQTSTNLQSWVAPIDIPITGPSDVLASPQGKQWQEVNIPMTGARKFMRLQFTTD